LHKTPRPSDTMLYLSLTIWHRKRLAQTVQLIDKNQ